MTTSPTREQIIEAMARAIYEFENPVEDRSKLCPDWERHPDSGRAASLAHEDHGREDYRKFARAALAAIASLAAIVPREATEKQLRIGNNRERLENKYAAMVESGDLSKAPK